MKTQIARLLRRLSHGAAGCLLGGALMVPMGGALTVPMGPTTTSQAVNQINSLATQPMAPSSATQRAIVGEPAQWVPDRAVSSRAPAWSWSPVTGSAGCSRTRSSCPR